jgi:transcription elongation factor Elf1
MITFECPWCTEPVSVDADLEVVSCDACGVQAQLAPDPVRDPIAVAA